MAGRYLATELQDDNGDVIYPHTEADIVFTSDGTTVEENLSGDFTDAEIQEIFSDNDSQLEAGKKLSVKEKIKRALKKYQTLLRMRILDTVEEVEANTDDGYLMGAKAGAALINDLAQQPEFVYDSTGKITGYKTPGGADTVFPFSSLQKDEGSFSATVLGRQSASVTVYFNKPFKEVPDFGGYKLAGSINGLGISKIISITKESCTFYVVNRESEIITETFKWIAVGEVQ